MLNLVEIWFSILVCELLQRGNFTLVADLIARYYGGGMIGAV